LGRLEGIERLGGIDVDEAVFGHVLRALGPDRAALEHSANGGAPTTAITQLRRACVDAKEALSWETSVAIPVWLRGEQREVLLPRAELEELVGPLLRPTVEALARVVASAGLRPDDLDAVLLVGGSSRIPMIARRVSAGLGRPVVVDAPPSTRSRWARRSTPTPVSQRCRPRLSHDRTPRCRHYSPVRADHPHRPGPRPGGRHRSRMLPRTALSCRSRHPAPEGRLTRPAGASS
jgi:hypothetical protein